MGLNLTALSLNQLGAACAEASPAFWGTRTDAELAALKLRLDTHWVRRCSLFPVTDTFTWREDTRWLHVALPLCISMLFAFMEGPPPAVAGSGVGLLIANILSFAVLVFAIWTMVTAFLTSLLGRKYLTLVAKQLLPITAEPLLCVETLAHVQECDSARRYRDQVVAGRQLRIMDAQIIEKLAAAQSEALCQAAIKALDDEGQRADKVAYAALHAVAAVR